MFTSQHARETALWLLDGERYPHGWLTGEFERKRYPSAEQAVAAFRERHPDLTQVRYHNTGDLLWYADAPAEREAEKPRHKPFPDILR
jgi:hypothetical protein